MDTLRQARRVAICGDDFGMDAGIDHAILRLIQARRLSAASCMSSAPGFAARGAELLNSGADVGLHLNLTERLGLADTPRPALRRLLWRAYSRQLDLQWVNQEICRQLDRFEDVLGQAPDYIDGHQHVHQLPGVRQLLLAELQRRYAGRRPWLRLTSVAALDGLPWAAHVKAHVIASLGGHALAARARASNWPSNRGFLGVYGFEGGRRGYARMLHHWLLHARDGDLLMCHPALAGEIEHAAQRKAEYEVLADPDLGGWLAANGLSVQRMSVIQASAAWAAPGAVGARWRPATGR